ncbi:glycosyl transferase family 1 [filamentous cyanobacterium CCP3]|nr:glycosyl transferase family 1 [filamentous cyanobacterium CCP3]
MEHIGLLCPPALGHLLPICNIGIELQNRGYPVTLFGLPDVKVKIDKTPLDFCPIESPDFPEGELDDFLAQISGLSSTRMQSLNFTVSWSEKATRMMFREAPDVIRRNSIDFLLVDQITVAGGTIADHLRLPYVTVCGAVPINQEPGIPPVYTHWAYQNIWWAKLRNQLGYQLLNYLTRPIWNMILLQRKKWNLPLYRCQEDAFSNLAQICQMPEALDFPREKRPSSFHYVGSLKNPSGVEAGYSNKQDIPFEISKEKPLIYASLGTLQSGNQKIFRCIAEACLQLEVQLVIDLGNPSADPSSVNLLEAIVLPFAPQQKLINKARLVITHAGSTAINCLEAGVPMVAIPITSDQPGMAARLARAGASEVIPLSHLTVPKLKACIEKVLSDQSYRDSAIELSDNIQKSGKVCRAADIIEQAIKTKAPVLGT